jgi:hypothetical protein
LGAKKQDFLAATVLLRMEPYADRVRLRLEHVDLSDPKIEQRSANARKQMTQILIRKKIRPDEASHAIVRTLDIAADCQLDVLRRAQDFRDLNRSK